MSFKGFITKKSGDVEYYSNDITTLSFYNFEVSGDVQPNVLNGDASSAIEAMDVFSNGDAYVKIGSRHSALTPYWFTRNDEYLSIVENISGTVYATYDRLINFERVFPGDTSYYYLVLTPASREYGIVEHPRGWEYGSAYEAHYDRSTGHMYRFTATKSWNYTVYSIYGKAFVRFNTVLNTIDNTADLLLNGDGAELYNNDMHLYNMPIERLNEFAPTQVYDGHFKFVYKDYIDGTNVYPTYSYGTGNAITGVYTKAGDTLIATESEAMFSLFTFNNYPVGHTRSAIMFNPSALSGAACIIETTEDTSGDDYTLYYKRSSFDAFDLVLSLNLTQLKSNNSVTTLNLLTTGSFLDHLAVIGDGTTLIDYINLDTGLTPTNTTVVGKVYSSTIYQVHHNPVDDNPIMYVNVDTNNHQIVSESW